MNQQEVFNKAYLAIVAQGLPSIDDKGVCLYRGLKGRKCAIGHLIPDELYDPLIEGSAPCFQPTTGKQLALQRVLEAVFSNLDKNDIPFLHNLQRCHDNAAEDSMCDRGCSFLEAFRIRCKIFATNYSLTLPQEPGK